jgi:hypothetical protein
VTYTPSSTNQERPEATQIVPRQNLSTADIAQDFQNFPAALCPNTRSAIEYCNGVASSRTAVGSLRAGELTILDTCEAPKLNVSSRPSLPVALVHYPRPTADGTDPPPLRPSHRPTKSSTTNTHSYARSSANNVLPSPRKFSTAT